MTTRAFAAHLFEQYAQYCLHNLRPAECKHGRIQPELQTLADQSEGLLTYAHIGDSLEGRSINLISCGSGKTSVLLWSQMHGDETTATLALADMFSLLAHAGETEKWIRGINQSGRRPV